MKIFFKTAVLVVLSFHLATAQDIRLGVKGSLNLTNIPNFTAVEALGQDFKYMATGGAALFAEIPLDQNFTFRPEVAYNRRGGKIDRLNLGGGTIGSIIGGLTNARLNIDYLDVPLLLQYKFSTAATGSAYVIAGPSVGFKVGSSMSNSLLGLMDLRYDLNLNYKDVDFGGVVGLGYEMPVRGKVKGFVEATYRHSFTNAIGDIGILRVDSKTSNFGFSVGLSMPVGK